MNAQRIKLNLIPGGVPPIVHVSQYDVGRPLEFALYDGVTAANIESGTVIDIRGTKPDKTGFSYPCTYSGNVVSIATREQMTAVSGSFDCELHLVKDAQDIGTANFILEVEPAALHEDTVISESELPAIIEAARNTGLTTEAVQELVASASASAASATAAANSASAAAASETNAADSASAAASSASSASTYASSASTSKIDAERSADSASTSASSASQSATRAQEYAAQALENATGATVFDGSNAGLVPSTNISNGFLNANGQWQEKGWMNNHSFTNRIIEGNTTPSALSKGALFVRRQKSDGEWRLCRAKTAIKADAELSYGNYEETSFQELLSEMQTSFQDGVDTVYNAVVAKGVTPSSSTPSAIATAIGRLLSPYNNIEVLYEKYQTEGYLGQTPRAYKFLIMQGKNCTIDDGTIILNHTYDTDSYNIKVAKNVPANTWLESESYTKKHFQCAIGIIN